MQRSMQVPPLVLDQQRAQAKQLRFAAYDDASVLLEPYEYLLQVPGKEIRSRIIDAFNMLDPSAIVKH